jgi:hypothetical protein
MPVPVPKLPVIRLIRQVKFIGEKWKIRQLQTELCKKSLQLGVFGFGGDQDGDVRVGVFPDSKEVLIRGAGLRGVDRLEFFFATRIYFWLRR